MHVSTVAPEIFSVGIQGEVGSFNEVAVLSYLERTNTQDYHIEYLSTTERVLAAVVAGKVYRGQFAVHNSLGSVVNESAEALAHYDEGTFTTVAEYDLLIAHAFMTHPDAEYADIKTIMTHPQVLAQCRSTLAQKYPHLIQVVGESLLIDPATVARELGHGRLSPSIAVLGNRRLAELNNLVVLEDNLQDNAENYTTFRLVKIK